MTASVTDVRGLQDIVTFDVEVANADPIVTITSAHDPVDEGGTVQLTGTVADPGADDVIDSVTVTWGDGTSAESVAVTGGGFAVRHTYDDDVAATITVVADDGEGGTDTATVAQGVVNVAPTIDQVTVLATEVDEGDVVRVTITASDPGADGLTASIDVGVGSPVTVAVVDGTAQATRRYRDDLVATPSATVTDDDGATSARVDGPTVTAANVAPEAVTVTTSSERIALGDAVGVTVGWTDPGVLDTHGATIAAGDGPVDLAVDQDGDEATGSITPSTAGTVTLTGTVTDDDGGVGAATAAVEVVDAAATPVTGQDDGPAPTSGDEVCRVIVLTDADGPLAGVPVLAELTGANGDASLTGAAGDCDDVRRTSASATTDADGRAAFTYVADAAGTDTLVLFGDLDGDGVRSANEPTTTSTIEVDDAEDPDTDGEADPGTDGGTDPDDDVDDGPESAQQPLPGGEQRLAGETRVTTAIEVSRQGYADGAAGAVVLTRSDLFPDALAGTPLAVQLDAPLLLTPPTVLDPATAEELTRVLDPGGTVHLLGGEVALSADVADAVADLGYEVVRHQGEDRYDTAVAIMLALPDPSGDLFVVTGTNFPDAVAAGAAAGATGGRVLLTAGDELPVATEAVIGGLDDDVEVFAVGGPAAAAVPDATPIIGATRIDTALQVADRFFDAPTVAGVATAFSFPDALTGGAQVGSYGGPMLLTAGDALSDGVGDALAVLDDDATVFLYGGPVALADQVASDVTAARAR